MQVRLGDVVRVNAQAVQLRRPFSYEVLDHEVRLLLSYLPDQVTGPLCLRMNELRSSSRHIRGFVSAKVVLRATARPVCQALAEALARHGVPGQVLTDIQAV